MPSSEPQRVIDGRYEVVRELGRGAMGVVYHVHDRAHERDLALKQLLLRSQSSTAGRQDRAMVRFRREFHTIAGLYHPSVVAAYEYGIENGQPYYTMELLEGPTLRDLLGAPVSQCCRMLRAVASALAFLHSRRLLHRDLKARNVRCDAAGQPKLLDFGVLVTMGVAGDVAGTPPSIPPEALRGLPLDGRSDLFGLGALAYRLLTSREAYPAESVEQLEDCWRRRPLSPSKLRPEVPAALDELVMSLLSVEAMARPSTAAEVIARLDAVAGLDEDHELDVAQGWLQSARLVGRAAELDRIRQVVEETSRGQGALVVVEGPSGVGKTRLLREAGVYAQLAGATVLRGRGRGVGYAPYDLVRQLVRELLRACPDDARRAGRESIPVLIRVLPELHSGQSSGDIPIREPPAEERMHLQQALLDWFVAVSKRRPLVLLIDDLERSDEGSAALLAALAHVAPTRAITVIGGARTDAEGMLPRSALPAAGEHLRLGELSRGAVAELVRDWFGDLPDADDLVEWIHGAAGGSPLHCSELARHLVEQGVVLYADGMWRLMADPSEAELPPRMAESMDLRVSGLSPLGRFLGQALALWRGPAPIELCAELLEVPDLSLMFEAIDELIYEEIIVGGDEGFDISHDGVRDALLRSLSPEEQREIHRHTAQLIVERWGFEGGERQADLGWHLLRGGMQREGAEHLERAGRRRYELRSFEDAIPPLEAALEVYRKDSGDEARCLELQAMLVRAGVIADRGVVVRHAESTIQSFARRAGLTTAHRLARWIGGRAALGVGVGLAHLRWWIRGRDEVVSPRRCLFMAVALSNYAGGVYALSFDMKRVDALRRVVEPLRSVRSPLVRAATSMLDAFKSLCVGRWRDAHREMDMVLTAFENQALGMASEMDRRMLVGSARTMQVVMQAIEQDPLFDESLQRLWALEMRFFALGAAMSRVYHHRLRGEEQRAAQVLHETELSVVQLGSSWTFDAVLAWVSAITYGITGDVVQLRRVTDELDRLDRAGMGLSAFVALARAELSRLSGDPRGACEGLRAALSSLPAEQLLLRLSLRASLVDALLDSGDDASAIEEAEQTLQEAPPGTGPRPARIRVGCGRVRALARRERFDAAHEVLEPLLEETVGVDSPLLVGLVHEAALRLAEAERDELGRRHHAARAELLFVSTGNPLLVGRARRLVAFMVDEAPVQSQSGSTEHTVDSDALDTVDIRGGKTQSQGLGSE